MPRKNLPRLTPLEATVMDRIWDDSPATVRDVHAGLKASRPMAYNTVLTVMRILREKGFLKSKRNGRADVYEPCVSREHVARRSVRELIDQFFAGSAGGLVSELLDGESLNEDEMRAIRREVNRRLKN